MMAQWQRAYLASCQQMGILWLSSDVAFFSMVVLCRVRRDDGSGTTSEAQQGGKCSSDEHEMEEGDYCSSGCLGTAEGQSGRFG